jgi:hypothetical protein
VATVPGPLAAGLAVALLAVLALAACAADPGGDGRPSRFRFGYAEVDVTPPVGTIMGGYGAPGQGRVTTGTHDPLLAQAALFVNDAGQAFLIVSADLAGYMWEFADWGPGIKVLRQAITAALAPAVTLAPEHIVVASSHSHAAPDLVGFNQDMGKGPDKALLAEMQRKLTDAAVAAAAALADAELWLGTTELVGASERDKGCSPVLDTSVAILQARDPSGKVLLTLANYAKHPTIAPESNRLASADFIWGFRDDVGKATGAPAMFLQGFEAAVHGKYSFYDQPDVWDKVHEIGSDLARVVLDAPLARATEFDIRHRAATYSCVARDTFLTMAIASIDIPKRSYTVEADGTYVVSEIEVSWHKVGPAEFVVFPGEPSPEYSVMAKQRMASPFRFAVAQGNDSIGYMVEPESMANDASGQLAGYENMMGLGSESGPAAWKALEGLGWFDGGWASDDAGGVP